MALPKQVEATLKELEIIEKQLEGQQNPPNEELEPKAELAPEPQPEVKPEPPVDAAAEETWQQKYRTLKGMYDAEVPRLHSQVKELTARMEQFQRDMEVKKPEPKLAYVPEQLVTDEDVQAFGEDLIEVQRKVAREVAGEFRRDLDSLKAENEELRKQLSATGSQVNEASFEQRLHRLVPNFQEVNADPKWIEWLDEVDPLLRAPRKVVAQEAFNRADAEGVKYYVDLFLKNIGSVAPNSKATELQRQIQPNRSASATAQPSPKGRNFTNADIEKMFQKAAELSGKGRIEEALKLEAEIDAAYMEGRVVN
jgi:hypothetical protein